MVIDERVRQADDDVVIVMTKTSAACCMEAITGPAGRRGRTMTQVQHMACDLDQARMHGLDECSVPDFVFSVGFMQQFEWCRALEQASTAPPPL
ncbi:MAG: hypothetical protein WD928_01255 [Gammaproteobacteria bacterium]